MGTIFIRVPSDKRHKQHVPERGNFKHGILRVCEFLSWRHQTRRIGTSGQGHHHTIYKNDGVQIARAWHVHRICTSCYLFQAVGQTNRVTSYNSGMALPIVTKFVVLLELMLWCLSHRSWVVCFCTCTRAHVQMLPSASYLGSGWTDCA